MIIAYLAGVATFAWIYGFNTRGGDGDGPRLVVTCLGWPLIVLAGLGQACRLFNGRRHLEDLTDQAE